MTQPPNASEEPASGPPGFSLPASQPAGGPPTSGPPSSGPPSYPTSDPVEPSSPYQSYDQPDESPAAPYSAEPYNAQPHSAEPYGPGPYGADPYQAPPGAQPYSGYPQAGPPPVGPAAYPAYPGGGYSTPAPPSSNAKGFATGSLGVGLLSVVGAICGCCCGPFGGISANVAGLVAIVLGVVAIKQDGPEQSNKGMAIGGIAAGAVGIIIGIIVIIVNVLNIAGSAMINN